VGANVGAEGATVGERDGIKVGDIATTVGIAEELTGK
jgi:hypothetical protein